VSEEIKTENLVSGETGAKPSAQQRKSPRFKVNWPSRALLPGKRIIAIRTKDVSIGGVGFESGESMVIGSEMNIELTPWVGGREYVIRAKCIITYNMLLAANAGFSHGVRFTFVPPDQLENLKMVLKSLES
jgi:hypothetical protein